MKIKALIVGALALAASLVASPAVAGSSCQYITTGAVLTAAQWNSCFQAKQNELGYTPINRAGDGMQGLLTTPPATTSTSGFRIYPGAAPSAPTDGDLWTTTSGLFVRINGTTIGPMSGATSSSYAATSPVTVSFPAGVVTYAFDFSVANTWTATQTMRTILAGTTNTFDVGTSATVAAFRTIYAGTSFIGPAGTFTTSVAVGGATIGGNALAVTGTSQFNSAVTVSSTLASAAHTITSASASALAVGVNGATNPAFLVDASGSTSVTGVRIFSSAVGTGAGIVAISSGTDENISLNAKGAGIIAIGNISTGTVNVTPAFFGSSNVFAGSTAAIGITSRSLLTSTSDGLLAISNNAGTNFTRLQFGGTTSSFPSIKRNAAALNFRVADDTADAAITALSLNGNTFTTGTYTLTGVAGKTLTFNKSITLEGTDSTTMTFPSVSATIPRTVANNTKALATGAIASATCTTAQTDTATGALTSDSAEIVFASDPTGVTGYAPTTSGTLSIFPYITADTMNFKVCNNTLASITPGAMSLNWRIVR